MSHQSGRRSGWNLMAAVLAVEALGLIALVVLMLVQVFRERSAVVEHEFASEVTTQSIGLILVVGLASVWVVLTLLGTLRRKNWAKASNFTLQILTLAAATGVFQGIMGSAAVGWVLLALAVLGVVSNVLLLPRAAERGNGQTRS